MPHGSIPVLLQIADPAQVYVRPGQQAGLMRDLKGTLDDAKRFLERCRRIKEALVQPAFSTDVIQEARKRKLDPRFVLAIMKQESTFRPGTKSPSAARGLLQLTIDTVEFLFAFVHVGEQYGSV